MGGAIGPGDFVERDPTVKGWADTLPPALTYREGGLPAFGQIYRVRAMRELRVPSTGQRYQGLRLDGIVADIPGCPDAYWPARAFRPVYRPDNSLIEGLLKPADTPAEPERVNA